MKDPNEIIRREKMFEDELKKIIDRRDLDPRQKVEKVRLLWDRFKKPKGK